MSYLKLGILLSVFWGMQAVHAGFFDELERFNEKVNKTTEKVEEKTEKIKTEREEAKARVEEAKLERDETLKTVDTANALLTTREGHEALKDEGKNKIQSDERVQAANEKMDETGEATNNLKSALDGFKSLFK